MSLDTRPAIIRVERAFMVGECYMNVWRDV